MSAPRTNLLALVLALAGSAVAGTGQTAPAPEVVLTNAAQIRSLPAAQAAQALPVRLRGVMISEAQALPLPSGGRDHQRRALVISDPTAAIYIVGTTNLLAPFREGDLLEVDGVTDPGQFAPIVEARAARRLGTAPIPPAAPATYQKLITGDLDAQWVEISGVVRNCEAITSSEIYGDWLMELAMDGNKVTVTARGPRPPQIEPDAEVRIQCVCFYQFNESRQVLRPALVMPRGAAVEIVRPAPANPFAAPVRPLAGMLQFAPDKVVGHRIHVRGTVTFQQSDQMIWIRDASGAAAIQARHAEALQPGDIVDVLGFPVFGSTSAMLEDAVVRKHSSGPAPEPEALAAPAAAFRHQADLVSLEAVLTEMQPIFGGEMLTLEDQGTSFKAIWRKLPAIPAPRSWQPGSRVRIAGICTASADEAGFTLSGIWHPESFQILLRSADDLTVLARPPWWTPQHAILFLGSIIGGLLLVTAAVMLLARRRLTEQGRQRTMAEAEFTAILSERNRLAREIHDTLAQGLVATSVQLRLAQKELRMTHDDVRTANAESKMHNSKLAEHVESAQQLVRHSLQEARNSIWNMRSQVLENGDLAGALKDILQHMVDEMEVETHFEVAGKAHRLAPVVEGNLLRVGQEAITNAAKHAQARHLNVRLEFGEKQFQLTVRDDGRGFDPARTASGANGFGLVGMRERAAALQGELSLRSAPGQGAEIKLTIPIPGE